MATNEKLCHGLKVLPFVGGGKGFFFLFSVWRVDFRLSMQAFFPLKKIKISVGVKAKSSQVPDMFPIAC